MSLSLIYNSLAIAPRIRQQFIAVGGVGPYTYSVDIGGAGGTIDSSGLYTAPSVTGADVVRVTDSTSATFAVSISILSAMELFMNVLQTEMGLASGRIYQWDQKLFSPSDNGLFIAVGIRSCKPFSNITAYDGAGSGLNQVQSTNFRAELSVDAISRGTAARDRKEEIIMAFNSTYARQQMELNSFYIAPLSSSFLNLSEIDGAAIPYRFSLSVGLQYSVTKTTAVQYFDTFAEPSVDVDP